MAQISIEDLHHLAELEKSRVSARTQREAALAKATASRERIRSERNGVSLPSSADTLDRLREEQKREFTGRR